MGMSVAKWVQIIPCVPPTIFESHDEYEVGSLIVPINDGAIVKVITIKLIGNESEPMGQYYEYTGELLDILTKHEDRNVLVTTYSLKEKGGSILIFDEDYRHNPLWFESVLSYMETKYTQGFTVTDKLLERGEINRMRARAEESWNKAIANGFNPNP